MNPFKYCRRLAGTESTALSGHRQRYLWPLLAIVALLLATPGTTAAQDSEPCAGGQVLVVDRSQGVGRCVSLLDLWPDFDASLLGSWDVITAPVDPPAVSTGVVPGSEDLGADACADSHGQALGGNPINVANGNKHEAEVDYVGTGRLPLTLVRHYNSASPQQVHAPFGASWTAPVVERLYGYDSFQLGTFRTEHVYIDNGTGAAVFVSRQAGEPWRREGGKVERLGRYPDGSWIHVDGTLVKRFRPDGLVTRIEHESGETHSFTYDTAKRLTAVTHSSGRALRFAYNAVGLVVAVTDPAGQAIRYGYDASRRLVSVTYPSDDGTVHQRRYVYDSPAGATLLTGIVDENGVRYATFRYDAGRRAVSSEHAGGAERFSVSYLGADATGTTRSRATNALGKVTDYSFRRIGGKWRATAADGQARGTCLAANRSYAYDTQGYLDRVTDWEGNVTEYDHDALGNVTRVMRGAGTAQAATTSFEWNAGIGKPTRVTSALLDTFHAYDARGRLTQVRQVDRTPLGTPGLARTWTIGYGVHANGVVSRQVVDGPRSDVVDTTTYDYDSGGRLLRATNAAGHVTQFQNYDAHGRVGRIVFPTGLVSDFVYHPRGWIKTRRDYVDGTWRTTNYAYDKAGQLTRLQRPDGSVLTFSYDGARRLTRVTDGRGDAMTHSFDAASNLTRRQVWQAAAAGSLDPVSPIVAPAPCSPTSPYLLCPTYPLPAPGTSPGSSLTSPVVASETREYDALGRLARIIGGSGQATRFGYDRNDRLVEAFDGRNNRSQVYRDALQRPYRSVDAAGGMADFGFDQHDDVTSARDPGGATTTYRRNGFGDIVAIDSPDAGASTFQYDLAGNLVRKVDARGVVSTFAYDALNRVTAARRGTDTAEIFQYDIGRRGFLYRVTDAAGSHTLSFNAAGQLTARTDVVAGRTLAMSWTYDGGGRLLQVRYPSGLNVEYGYDIVGRVSKLEAWSSSLARRIVVQDVGYAPFGPLTGLRYGNGETRSVTLDLDFRPTRIASGTWVALGYSYDASGNVTAISDAPAGQGRTFGYDALNRLSQHTGPDGALAYQYDANGNRTWKSTGSNSVGYGYGAGGNRLTSVASETRSLDAAGNTTRIGARYFDYDGAGRLWRHRSGPTTTTYAHSAFGERQLKMRGGVSSWFVYAGPNLLHEQTGSVTQEYLYLDGAPVALVRNGVLYYVHGDHLGRPQVVTNAARGRVWQARNDAFDSTPVVNLLGEFNLGLPGQYRDTESGTWHNHFRTYDAATGRYLQHDPIGLAGGLNGYAYAGNNPVGIIDPWGLEGVDVRRGILERALVRGDISQDEYWAILRAEGYGGAIGAAVVVAGVCLGPAGLAKEAAQTAFEELTGIPTGIPSAAKGIRSAAKAISTPHGMALQADTPEALAALERVRAGATVYRQGSFGAQRTSDAQFWALQRPANNQEFARRLGMPGDATRADWIMGGKVSPDSPVITRPAPGIGKNAGGSMEAVVPPGGVRDMWFHMLE